jgi:hypothetical protein
MGARHFLGGTLEWSITGEEFVEDNLHRVHVTGRVDFVVKSLRSHVGRRADKFSGRPHCRQTARYPKICQFIDHPTVIGIN